MPDPKQSLIGPNDSRETRPFLNGVLPEELRLIRLRRGGHNAESTGGHAPDHPNPVNQAHDVSAFGLAFSGGGIRSATFNLGVAQALAEKRLLRHVDYLSTVSGGGYIGTWLHGVIRNRHDGRPENVEAPCSTEARRSKGTLLAGIDSEPGPPDSDPITFLRKYSNYLAPRVGLFSADTWVIGQIWIRNVLLNQLILMPAVATVAAIAFLLVLVRQIPWIDVTNRGFSWVPAALAFAGLLTAVLMTGQNLKPIARQSRSSTPIVKSPFEVWAETHAWLVVVGVFLATLGLAFGEFDPFRLSIVAVAAFAAIGLMVIVQWRGGFIDCFVARHNESARLAGIAHAVAWLNVLWMSVVSGLVTTALVWAVWRHLDSWEPSQVVAFGPPLIALGLMAGVMLLIGLMGADYPDAAREWTARIGSQGAIVITAWAALLTLAIYGPPAVSQAGEWAWARNAAILSWVMTTVGGVLAGRSSQTSKSGGTGVKWALELLVNVAPTVFLIGYVIAISAGVRAALAYLSPAIDNADPYVTVLTLGAGERALNKVYVAIGLLVGFVIVGLIASSRININEFSLHHFYKNRLVRCYLGASKTGAARPRQPNPLTGFDPLDDFPIASLSAKPRVGGGDARPYYGPYPIVNATLNLNSGSELAQQERKAASFVFTPAFCGFDPPTSRVSMRRKLVGMEAHGYRSTGGYSQPAGPHIGTTMAISGAAANPNWGYHTSGPMAFLLTVFNARLGWWLGNPRWDVASRNPGPVFALKYLLAELLGQTTGVTKFVNLSDGGHFDNLGVYELVRRRCRFILVSDAEEDRNLTFGSLGGVIRKCRADFGVEIDINPRPIRKNERGLSETHCVVGRIRYPEPETAFLAGATDHIEPADPKRRYPAMGWLVYIKSSLSGDEPADVLEYHSRYKEFPHQSTADQFFTESQFESYRRLGYHVLRSAFEDVKLPDACAKQPSGEHEQYPLVKLFQELTRKWYAPIPISAEAASRLADTYVNLMQQLSKGDTTKVLFDELTGTHLSTDDTVLSSELVAAGMAVTQLMENVYTEFKLEHAFNVRNPRNAGWMDAFRKWVKSPILYERIWPKIRDDYHPIFRRFVETLRAEAKLEEPSPL